MCLASRFRLLFVWVEFCRYCRLLSAALLVPVQRSSLAAFSCDIGAYPELPRRLELDGGVNFVCPGSVLDEGSLRTSRLENIWWWPKLVPYLQDSLRRLPRPRSPSFGFQIFDRACQTRTVQRKSGHLFMGRFILGDSGRRQAVKLGNGDHLCYGGC